MGYRSDVVIAVRADAVLQFEQACPLLLAEMDERFEFEELRRPLPILRGWCYCSHLKWYADRDLGTGTGFESVNQWYAWADEADPEKYRFVRMGEDTDDIETDGQLDVPVWVSRDITKPRKRRARGSGSDRNDASGAQAPRSGPET